MAEGAAPVTRPALQEVASFFLRLGTTAFGGPAAHIAMMEAEVVRRRRWVAREEFLDLLGAANLLPGPSSTEMAIFLGYRRAGWPGLVLGGLCFLLPAAVLTLLLAWAYVRFGALPRVGAALYGIKPVIIAVVVQALWALGRSAMKSWGLAVLALAAAAAAVFGINPALVLLAAGVLSLAARWGAGNAASMLASIPAAAPLTAIPASLGGLFLVFLKIGAILFGSGYVLLAFLRADLVEHRHWLTEPQLLDAVAAGQITPGPVFTTATFVGYVLAGVPGALVATVAIFFPSFLLVAASGPLVPRLRRSPLASAFLDGVNGAALALMAVVTWQLGRTAIFDVRTATLAVVAAVLLIRFRMNSVWLVVGGALAGLALSWIW